MTMPWIFQSPAEAEEEESEFSSSSSSSSSSIGRNSDLWGSESSDSEDCQEENEVQSAYKGKCHSTDALEEALPIRRGISEFYNGRSKSFICLAKASSSFSTIKDIAKPEDVYTRTRRNELAHRLWNKHKSNGCGIAKKPVISSRKSTLASGFIALSRSESISSTNSDFSLNFKSPEPENWLPRSMGSHNNLASLLFSQQKNLPMRKSFSLPEIRQCVTSKTTIFGCRLLDDKK